MPPRDRSGPALDALQGLSKAAFFAALALASQRGISTPRLDSDASVTLGTAIAILDDVVSDMFVRLRPRLG